MDFTNIDMTVMSNNTKKTVKIKTSIDLMKSSKSKYKKYKKKRMQMSRSNSGMGIVGESQPRMNTALETTYIQSTKNMSDLASSRLQNFCIRSKKTQINQYVLMKRIGKGGWSDVLLAVDTTNQQKRVDFLFIEGDEID
jgi:hypothetical protein